MLTKEEIEKIVINSINIELQGKKQKLKITEDGKWKEAQFNSDLGLDSLNTVELFMECEKECGVTFTDEEILKADTVGKLIDKIVEKLSLKQ